MLPMVNTHLYKPNLVIVISGPSGSGKSTVINALCEADETLIESVSATTRQPRRGETDGVDYHFLSKPEFEKYVQQNRFLEWAEYGGNFYGTLKSEIVAAREAEKDAILEIEVKGCFADPIARFVPSTQSLYLHHTLILRYLGGTAPSQKNRIGNGTQQTACYREIRNS